MKAGEMETMIAEGTQKALAQGTRVLQIHWLKETAVEHVRELLLMMNPPEGAMIADIGSGVGEVAVLMEKERPDIDFLLVNNNKWQHENSAGGQRIFADMHETGITEGFCDVVMMNYSLGYAELGRMFKEASRMLKAGGTLFIWDFVGPSELMEELLLYKTHTLEEFAGAACDAGFEYSACWVPPVTYKAHFDQLSDEASQVLLSQIWTEVQPAAFKFKKRGG